MTNAPQSTHLRGFCVPPTMGDMSTTVSVNDDQSKVQPLAHRRRRGNYLALTALPFTFILLPWALALTLPEQAVIIIILVGTPLVLATLAAYDAATYRPNLTFGLLAAACMWLATRLFYPSGAGWYIPLVILLYALAVFPWRQKFKDEWESPAKEEGA